jgi:hypothetical protein
MITLSITEYLISLFIIPIIIVSVYYLNRIGFFHYDEEVTIQEFKFITLNDNEGETTK